VLILRDTREQNPWQFENAEAASLKTGDYTLRGLEDKLCIERKGCVEELAGNLGRDFERFKRELERMRAFPHRFIICEFSFFDVATYPQSCSSRKAREAAKMSGKFLVKRLSELQTEYDVHIMFFDSRDEAMMYVESLMKRVYERYK